MVRPIQCDVLVIGGGLAGCWAALRAAEVARRVVLADIGKVSRCSQSAFAGAGILYSEPSDDLDAWQQEIVEKGQYLNDQDWLRIILDEGPARLRDMGDWGLEYERDSSGQVFRHGGLSAVKTRNATVSSLQMMEVMRRKLQEAGITLLERVMVTGLLTSDGLLPTRGSVVGAVAFHTRTGETFAVNAGATVVTSGAGGFFGAVGEGIAYAYQAGAETFNLEFARLFDEMCFEDRYFGIGIHLITFQRLGMKLLNSRGERFMERYSPALKEMGRREDLGLAIVTEGLQGRSPVYMDLTHLDENGLNQLRTLPGTARLVRSMEEEGFDFRKRPLKYSVTSGPLFVRIGGIKHNVFGETSLPGLYTAGQAGGYPTHGATAIGGVNLVACSVGGYRAGEHAARFAREYGLQAPTGDQIRQQEEKMLRPLTAATGLRAASLADEMHSFLSPARVSVFRDATSLRRVLGRMEDWKGKAGSLQARDYHELTRANRMAAYVQCAELVFSASLAREESRANNIRIDFPYLDNVNWLKWIVQHSDSRGRPAMKTVPLPLYRYPVRPKEYSRVPVEFPYPTKK